MAGARDPVTTDITLATFEHPAKAYRLRYPAPWEYQVQQEGRSCGFGPRDRDDVGLARTLGLKTAS